jgi:hypothetical protein
MGLDTKTYWLTGRQSQCDFDFDLRLDKYVQLEKENPGTGNIRGLNLAAVKPTTVQVSNCRFLGLNKLRHKLLHYPALTDVPVYSRT